MEIRRLKRTTFPLFLLLFIIALLPRLFYLAEAREIPLFHELYLDAKSYDTWATKLAGGEWVGGQPFHMAPLYPYLLGVFYKLFGHNLLLLRILQHALGAGSTVLLFSIARRLFGGRVGAVAFILALGYGPFLYFEGQVLASSVGVFFGLASLHLLITSLEKGGRGLWLAGLVLGIGSVARPNLLFFFPLAFLWILIRERGARRAAPLYLAGFLIALAPSTLHNYFVSNEFIPISSHGGISFYLGNNQYTRGTYVPPPQFGGTPEAIDIYDSRRHAEAALGRQLGTNEISRFWYGESFRFIRENPVRYTRLVGRKIALYFNAFEIPLDYNFHFDRTLYRVLRLAPFSYGILISLGLAGIGLIPRSGSRGWILPLFLAANAVSVILFFICARYRQTAVPAVAILAALTLVRMAEFALRREWRRFAGIGLAALALAIPVHLDLYAGRSTSESRSACILGRAWASSGETEKAEEAFRHALSVRPDHVDSRMNLGSLYYGMRRYPEAVQQFTAATEVAPRFAGAWNNLGNARREAGRIGSAIQAIETAVRCDTAYAEAWNNLAYTLGLAGRVEKAEEAFREALRLDRRSVHTWANLADLRTRAGDFPGAIRALDDGIRAVPNAEALRWKRDKIDRAAQAYHGVLQSLGRGDRTGAARFLRKAIEEGGDPVRSWADHDPALAGLRSGAPPPPGPRGRDRR